MKSILMLAVFMLAPSFVQAKDKSNKQGGNVDQALMHIEQEMVDALLKGDVSANERYLADTFIFTDPDGMVMDKTRMVADLKSGDLKLESSKSDDMKVQAYGNAAIVTYGTTDKGSYKGKDLSGRYRWTDVFVKRNGRWQIVATQGTRIGQQ
jgi:ketosteroid isomerase-like protein